MTSISHIITWLSHVSETCFTACYALVMVLEISRLFFRVAVRHALILAITAAGLFAHVVWFCLSARTTTTTPLVSWYGWCMLIALALVFVYLWLRIQYPDKSVGLFLLPMVIGVIGTALVFLSDQEPIVTKASLSFWSILHGMALLLGSIAATLGFIAGIMYLVQSFRLKRKIPPRQGLRLPSLEQLQRYNYWLLTLSTGLLATGLLAGIIRKACLSFAAETSAPWNPIVVISSVLLLLWLIITGLFEYFYKPARQGKKVAYLTVTSFILLGAVMVLVFSAEHAVKIETSASQTLNSRPTSGNREVQE